MNFVTSSKKILEDDENLQTKLTYFTLEIDSKKKMKLIFGFKNFKEELFIDRGRVRVTFPYEEFEGMLSEFVQAIPIH